MRVLKPETYDYLKAKAEKNGGVGMIWDTCVHGLTGVDSFLTAGRNPMSLELLQLGISISVNDGAIADWHIRTGRSLMPWADYCKALRIVRGEEVDPNPLMSSEVEGAISRAIAELHTVALLMI